MLFGWFKKSVPKREIVVNVEKLETRVAVVENGRVEEFQEERARRHARTRRKPWRAALCLRHLLRGNDQAPD